MSCPYKRVQWTYGLYRSPLGQRCSRPPSNSVAFWPGIGPNFVCHAQRTTTGLQPDRSDVKAGCWKRMKISGAWERSEYLVGVGELLPSRNAPPAFEEVTGVWDLLSVLSVASNRVRETLVPESRSVNLLHALANRMYAYTTPLRGGVALRPCSCF